MKNECQYIKCSNKTINPKYCSLSCGAKQQAINAPQKQSKIIRKCINSECRIDFLVHTYSDPKKFCSHSCSAKSSNKNRAITRYCANKDCGEQLKKNLPKAQKYCSPKCSSKVRKQNIINSWLNGEWDGSSKYGLSSTIRKYLIKEANYKCQSPTCCVEGGWGEINPATGNPPLEIDHVDGDAYNNSFANNNLIVLCPNCHSLTASYRSLNKKSSRKWRKKYNQLDREFIEDLTK